MVNNACTAIIGDAPLFNRVNKASITTTWDYTPLSTGGHTAYIHTPYTSRDAAAFAKGKHAFIWTTGGVPSFDRVNNASRTTTGNESLLDRGNSASTTRRGDALFFKGAVIYKPLYMRGDALSFNCAIAPPQQQGVHPLSRGSKTPPQLQQGMHPLTRGAMMPPQRLEGMHPISKGEVMSA